MGLQNPAKSLKTQRGRGRSGATATNHECASTNNMVVRFGEGSQITNKSLQITGKSLQITGKSLQIARANPWQQFAKRQHEFAKHCREFSNQHLVATICKLLMQTTDTGLQMISD